MERMMFRENNAAAVTTNSFSNNSNQSLFEKIGGEEAIDKLAMIFYIKVMNDPDLKHFFAGIDMLAQIMHQKDYITYVLGGSMDYKGKSLRDAHRHLSINASDFDKTALHFVHSLIELELPINVRDEIMTIIETTRSEILNLDYTQR